MPAVIGAVVLTLLVGSLSPHRLYYQVNRPMPITISPQGEHRQLVLLTPANVEVARADLAAEDESEVDVHALFPDLYSLTTLHYLQLMVAGEPTGAALVLQPMVTRPTPVLRYINRGGTRVPFVNDWTAVNEASLVMSGFRVYVERLGVLHTTMGDVTLALRPDEAPNTVYNFIHLVEGGFYTHIPFHRIVARDGQSNPFVIQAGDPSGTGDGSAGYDIEFEATKLPHRFGVISMAREGHDINTAGTQFFLCLSRAGTARLDGQYAAFGQTIAGEEVIRALAAVEVDADDRPLDMPYVESAELIDADPRIPGERPSTMRDDAEAAEDDKTGDADRPVER